MRLTPVDYNVPVLDRRFDFDSETLTALELMARLKKKQDEIIEAINSIDLIFSQKEDSTNITNKRKLSPNGDFTGTLQGKPVSGVLSHLDDNEDKIRYLANQFSDGQTGLVIDCGFFEQTAIAKNFDGGVFLHVRNN